jgi:2-(1,2-epoxy-1,2-dihydrophenyl)acetyl-CoA isomerase
MDASADLMKGSVEAVCERLAGSSHRITRALHSLQVPSVAAVNGAAVYAGFDVALVCDLCIASEKILPTID